MADLNLVVQLLADTKSLNKSVQGIDKQMAGLKRSVIGLGAGLGLAFGAREAIDVLGGAITKAEDLAEAQSRLDQIYGDSASTVQHWADTTAASYRLSGLEATNALGDIGALLRGAGLEGQELADSATLVAEAVGDIASFNNLSSMEALQKVMAGLAGEAEPLRRLGFDMTVAGVAASTELVPGLEDANNVLRRIAALDVQAGLIGITGDSVRTLDSVVGKSEQLRIKVEDLEIQLGELLLPWKELFLDGALTAITNLHGIAEAITAIGDAIRQEAILEGFDPLAWITSGPAGALASLVNEFVGDAGDLRDELGLTQEAYIDLLSAVSAQTGEDNIVALNREIREFVQTDAGREMVRQLGGLPEVLEDVGDSAPLAAGGLDELALAIPKVLEETIGDAERAGFTLGDVLQDAFTIDPGSFDPIEGLAEALDPRELVRRMNKELYEANKALSEILADPEALNSEWEKVDRRMSKLLKRSVKLETLTGPAKNLGIMFVSQTVAGVKQDQQKVLDQFRLLGLDAGDEVTTAGTVGIGEVRGMFPDSTTLQAIGGIVGRWVGLGFISGFKGSGATTIAQDQDTSQGGGDTRIGPGAITIHTSGDPAAIESAVVGALRRFQRNNGVQQLRGI